MLNIVHRFKSDESLALSYQRGDRMAFEELYRRYKDHLFAFVYRGCSNHSITEELVHDAWVGLIDSIDRYQVKAKFKTYLYSIAHKKLADYWRKQDKVKGHETFDDEIVDSNTLQPSEQVHLEQIMQLIANLPDEQRHAFLLREEGFSYQEIGNIVGVGKETVKSRIRYARNTLKQQLVDEKKVVGA